MAKILGIGNALVDSLIQVKEEELLSELNLPKGSMQLVDFETKEKIAKRTESFDKSVASGGSAANTIHGIARLGTETAYIGTVGKDATADVFVNDLKKSNITPLLKISDKTPSGLASTLITSDGERTFGTYLGAAIELSASDLKSEDFKGYDYLHIEGYLVQNHDLIEQSLKLAHDNGLKISIDMASYNVVEDNLDFLRDMVINYVDIVFANEEEAKAFTAKEPMEALNEIAEMCGIAVVKIGKEGSLIKSGDEVVKVGVIETNVLDTTGAGDLYASGFLHGLANDRDFEYCGKLAALCAGTVISNIGAKINDEQWNEIHLKEKEF